LAINVAKNSKKGGEKLWKWGEAFENS